MEDFIYYQENDESSRIESRKTFYVFSITNGKFGFNILHALQ